MGMLSVMIIAAIAMAVGGWYFSDRAKTLRAMRAAPRRAIAEVADGEVARLVGRVVPRTTLVAPLTGRPCTYWRVEIDRLVQRRRSTRWQRLGTAAEGATFALDDAGGRAIVDPRAAQLVVVLDTTTRSGTFDDATPIEEALLARLGEASRGVVFNHTVRYREGVLEAGEQIAVVGRCQREVDPDSPGGGFRDVVATRVQVGATETGDLLITDDPTALA